MSNPYLSPDIKFEITTGDIDAAKKKIKYVGSKRDFMNMWNKNTKEELKRGMFSESDMAIVENYFSNLKNDNTNRMKVYRNQLAQMKSEMSLVEFEKQSMKI